MTGQLQVPRPRLLAELDRLMASGAVVEAGPNASCGRRRSPVVDLNPDLRLAAIDLDARSVGVEVAEERPLQQIPVAVRNKTHAVCAFAFSCSS
ncbi:hypothetical protein ACWDAZ_41060, partial [Streptomyces sp. NPDC001215]